MNSRQWFDQASAGLKALLPGLAEQLDSPALGTWSIRSLLGHTSRAFTTVDSYLAFSPIDDSQIDLDSPAAYYKMASASLADPVQVAERGRKAGLALGRDPLAATQSIIETVLSLVDSAEDEYEVATPLGSMKLGDYLPTRAFEVTVHSIDLAVASGQAIPTEILECIVPSLDLATRFATSDQQLQLLLSVTGRKPLPSGFTIL